MHAATTFTWSILNQTTNPSERKNVSIISLVIEDMPGNTPAHTTNISIHLNSNFIGNYTANLRRQFNGIIYQEVAGIWQWDGEGKAPRGLVSGIASYVRLKARYGTSEKVKPGEGERWDEGEGVTARFLVYCSKLKRGFVGEMNKKMRHGYTDGLFVELLGKRVELLWSNYKERNARYGTSEKVRGGDGNRWDEGDGVTCRFLEYCEEVKKGFVMELNRKMRYGYTNAYFVDLLGKSVDQVWKDYKAKYPPKH
ncbi:hypothetical protein LINPERPRIM_LOCUS26438 [Linum perenne]